MKSETRTRYAKIREREITSSAPRRLLQVQIVHHSVSQEDRPLNGSVQSGLPRPSLPSTSVVDVRRSLTYYRSRLLHRPTRHGDDRPTTACLHSETTTPETEVLYVEVRHIRCRRLRAAASAADGRRRDPM